MKEPHVAVPVRIAQLIVNYLKSRPFEEVNEMIGALVQAPRIEIAPAAPPAPGPVGGPTLAPAGKE